ncbi:MAG: DUF4384 domain-containing protein [Acidobacteriota bacterium]
MVSKFLLLLISLLLLCNPAVQLAQEERESSARGIFDSQTNQKPVTNTSVKNRTYQPERPAIGKSAQKKVAKRSKRQPIKEEVAALRYIVLALGKETPQGYQLSSKLAKYAIDTKGRSYGITDPQQNFREGDIIKLIFEASRPGYLYIMNFGSDGVTRNLFYPQEGKEAYITPDTPAVIGPLKIDPPAGIDKLTVLFSTKPISALSSGGRNLSLALEEDISKGNSATIEEEEVHLPSRETTALYFANARGDGKSLIKAEIDIRHTNP